MTEQQINIAIAEALVVMKWSYALPQKTPHCDMPDYCNDLNAMHEAEKVIDQQCKHSDYWFFVRQICDFPDAESDWDRFEFFSAIHATARQRAEAFLKTLGKWTE